MSNTNRIDATTEEIDAIKVWLKQQPHLPDHMSDNMIKRFLNACYFDLDRTKKVLNLYYTIRHSAPEIFANRDPLKPEIEIALERMDLCPLPTPTEENYKVFIYKLHDTNPDHFDFTNFVKGFFMVADIRLEMDEDICGGEVPIFDLTGTTLKHLTRIVFSTLRKYMQYSQEGHPIRLQQIHMINAPSYVDKFLSIVKPLMKKNIIQILYTHTPNSETLYKFLPRDLLPEEYGGKGGKVEDIKQHWVAQVKNHRKYFLDESRWKVNESKIRNENGSSLKNLTTLKSLSID